MKIAILADIHGNAQALAAVLSAVREEGIDELLVAGDIVGYYFEPEKVLSLLAPWEKLIIRGNHEDALLESRGSRLALEKYEKSYGIGLRYALEKLSESQLDYLCSLPLALDILRGGYSIKLCHGSPWETDQYIYPDAKEELFQRCDKTDCDLVIMGHTHYPMLRSTGQGRVVNPGSVGQPRDSIPGAAWAVFNSDSGEISFRREHYDFESVALQARQLQPDLPYLSDVLLRC